MKRILIVGFTSNPGGIENVIMNYYRNIDRSKIQFDFLKNTETMAFEEEIISMGGKIYSICSRTKNYIIYKKDLKNFFYNYSKDYVAIWVNFCNLTNLDYLKFAKKYNINYRIIHSHNSQNMNSKIQLIVHKINRIFVSKYATDFWTCSNESGIWFYNKKIRKNPKYKIINNAIDINKFMYDEDIRKKQRELLNIQDKFVVGHIGRMQYQKNHIFLIEIFKEISKKINNAHLVLVGKGEEEQKIREKVKKLNLEDKVTFMGVINNINEILNAMDIFVFPSVFEGLGLVLIEAQANGISVFASKNVIPSEVKMSENFDFISLNQTSKEWSDFIINKYNKNLIIRKNNITKLKENGYDITEEAKKLEDYLERK